jgi:hypothetical protein
VVLIANKCDLISSDNFIDQMLLPKTQIEL